ncbi:unnamed protein product [Rhizophagus irregularis]|nr:unnamed protein product [Rhizophagus irregularis]
MLQQVTVHFAEPFRRIVHFTEFHFTEANSVKWGFRETSLRGNVPSGKHPFDEIASAKRLSAKCPDAAVTTRFKQNTVYLTVIPYQQMKL